MLSVVRDADGKEKDDKGKKGIGQRKHDTSSGSGHAPRDIHGECGNCKKWGQKKVDCRQRVTDESDRISGGREPNSAVLHLQQ